MITNEKVKSSRVPYNPTTLQPYIHPYDNITLYPSLQPYNPISVPTTLQPYINLSLCQYNPITLTIYA
ncbi:hypothetical protein B484DRAFT_459466 [Ochromonadaceae sp. CCMP2298]|nr:hypothetical protein B484DRAFT_459466 [Ochromonadaceae sp. CCMP2298]